MKYLLDTDHISFLQLKSGPEYAALAARMSPCSAADFAFCIVSFHEQALGGHTYISRARTSADLVRGYTPMLEILQGFMTVPVLPFDAAASAVFDNLRAQKLRVGAMDLRIAATALAREVWCC